MFFGIANALLGYANIGQNILKIGDLAPNFILTDQEGKLHRLSDYRGRLSAVLYITSREGNRNKFEGTSSISLLSAQTTLEGPFLNGAWLFGGRRTYFDLLLPKILPEKTTAAIPPYYFYDLQGHIFSELR